MGEAIASRAAALLRCAHPGPSLVVSAIIVALATVHQGAHGPLAPLVIGVVAGQFSIGYANDAFDAGRDRRAGRLDKPVAAGRISRRTVFVAACVALAVNVLLCFVIGSVTGVVNLVMMAAGWAYNAGLKSTAWSAAMYAIGFGLIPAFAASTLPDTPPVPAWAYAAAALLGLGGHFANVLYDLDSDLRAGVRGLPQRIATAHPRGPAVVRVLCLLLLAASTVLVALSQGPALRWPLLLVTAGVAVTGILGRGRTPFVAAMGVAVLDVAALVFGTPIFG